MSGCAADMCCPVQYSYEQSPVDVCDDFCAEQGDGDYAFPGVESCCADERTFCARDKY